MNLSLRYSPRNKRHTQKWPCSLCQQVTVEFKATFLKINDIDTLSQQFEAEVFVQARWEERAFLGMNPKVGAWHFERNLKAS